MWALLQQTLYLLLERVMGVEPTSSAWKAEVLPLNYTRLSSLLRLFEAYKNPDSLFSSNRPDFKILCMTLTLVSRALVSRGFFVRC